MKHLIIFVFLAIVVQGCDVSKYFGGANSNANAVTQQPPKVKPAPNTESLPVTSTPRNADLSSFLKRSAGKYPYQVKLLGNAELNGRLKKLLGADLADLKDHWNVETPIQIEDGIFMASACEEHNCGANNYLIFVDLNKDNINVFHTDDNGTKHYFESGEIKLPKKFADEVGTNP